MLKALQSSPGSCDECSTAPGCWRHLDQANWLEPLLLLSPKAACSSVELSIKPGYNRAQTAVHLE